MGNFDKEFTSEEPMLTPVDTILSMASQSEFKGFSHISNWAKELRDKHMNM